MPFEWKEPVSGCSCLGPNTGAPTSRSVSPTRQLLSLSLRALPSPALHQLLTRDALGDRAASEQGGGRLPAQPLYQAVPFIHPAGKANMVSLQVYPNTTQRGSIKNLRL